MAVASGMLLAAKKTITSECDGEKHCSQKGLDAVRTGKILNAVGTAGAVAAGVGAAAFVTWLVWPKGEPEARARVLPAIGPGFAGVSGGMVF